MKTISQLDLIKSVRKQYAPKTRVVQMKAVGYRRKPKFQNNDSDC
jgi:hypothetical protein